MVSVYHTFNDLSIGADMKISTKVIEYQKDHIFEDVVANFLKDINDENVISLPNSVNYVAIWTFKDGSKLYLDNEVFYDYFK